MSYLVHIDGPLMTLGLINTFVKSGLSLKEKERLPDCGYIFRGGAGLPGRRCRWSLHPCTQVDAALEKKKRWHWYFFCV